MRATQPRSLTASQEDYLEAILGLMRETGAARVRDIAKRRKVAKSSVTAALRSLAKRKLVHYQPYELVTLSDRGKLLAERVRRRHKILSDFLTGVLDADERIAEANACRIEHAVGVIVMERLSCFLEFMSKSTVPASRLPQAFHKYCADLCRSGQCKGCQAAADRAMPAASSPQGQGDTNERSKA